MARVVEVAFYAPVRIESEMNRREHWAARRRRFADQERAVSYSWPKPRYRDYGAADGNAKVLVTLTRIAPRPLDQDNLVGGFKAVVDEIARVIGIDDGDKRMTYRYEQGKGKPKEYAIRVEIKSEIPD